jgi:hypothetical protein
VQVRTTVACTARRRAPAGIGRAIDGRSGSPRPCCAAHPRPTPGRSKPLSSEILMSTRATSGRSSSIRRRPSTTVEAMPTTISPSRSRRTRAVARKDALSSTTTTRSDTRSALHLRAPHRIAASRNQVHRSREAHGLSGRLVTAWDDEVRSSKIISSRVSWGWICLESVYPRLKGGHIAATCHPYAKPIHAKSRRSRAVYVQPIVPRLSTEKLDATPQPDCGSQGQPADGGSQLRGRTALQRSTQAVAVPRSLHRRAIAALIRFGGCGPDAGTATTFPKPYAGLYVMTS